MSNDQEFIGAIHLDSKGNEEIIIPENVKKERDINPIPYDRKGLFGDVEPLTKNQFKRWALSNGVGSSYSGKDRTMYIFGERAKKIMEQQPKVNFKVVIQD